MTAQIRGTESRMPASRLEANVCYLGLTPKLVVCADKEPPQVAGVSRIEERRSKVLVGTLHFLPCLFICHFMIVGTMCCGAGPSALPLCQDLLNLISVLGAYNAWQAEVLGH
jgi:hypothetical protein